MGWLSGLLVQQWYHFALIQAIKKRKWFSPLVQHWYHFALIQADFIPNKLTEMEMLILQLSIAAIAQQCSFRRKEGSHHNGHCWSVTTKLGAWLAVACDLIALPARLPFVKQHSTESGSVFLVGIYDIVSASPAWHSRFKFSASSKVKNHYHK